MAFSHITHHMGKIPDTQQYKIVRTTPIVRLGSAGLVIYLQAGKCWEESGKEMELPGWAYDAMSRMTPAALKEVGFDKVPEPPKGIDPRMLEPAAPEMWTCPDCEKPMEIGNKDAHIAKHNKHLAADQQIKSDPTLHLKH